MYLRRPAASLVTASLLGWGGLALAANGPIYRTGFEVLNDPSGAGFALASLNQQNGWRVNEGGAAFVVAGPEIAGAGTRFMKITAGSLASRSVPSDATHVVAKLKLRTAGTETLEAPAATDGIAVLLGLRKVAGDQLVMAGFDGGLQQFVEPDGGAPFAANQWNDITVAINYVAKNYTVAVNGAVLLSDVAFRNNTVAALGNFGVSTQMGSSLDELGLFASNGDYDNDGLADTLDMALGTDVLDIDSDDDGYSDGYEHAQGTNPLNGNNSVPDAVPVLGDIDENGVVNAADVTELANRISANQTLTAPQIARADVDGNGTVDMQDAMTIVEFAVKNTAVLR